MTLLIRNQNVRGRKALKKGQSLILCTVRNVSGQRYATSYIVSVDSQTQSAKVFALPYEIKHQNDFNNTLKYLSEFQVGQPLLLSGFGLL